MVKCVHKEFQQDSFTKTGSREKKIDTGEDRVNQRMKRRQKVRTHG